MTTSTMDVPLPETVGRTSDPAQSSWTADDSLLYALGVGAGIDELAYTTENSAGIPHQALPTMPVVVGQKAKVFHLLGRLDWTKVVHAEQSVELLRPVPVAGEIDTTGRIARIYDTGKHAIAVIAFDSRGAADGETWFRATMSLMLRGSGGWGGDPGPRSDWARPRRIPDHVVTQRTAPEQALLYRLSGDRNRLHSDPAFARKAGFERPILHGLCTYGFAGRALLATACDGDPTRFASMRGRFSAPVLPGEELRTAVWIDGERALFETVGADGAPRLTSGVLELRTAGAA